MKKVSIGKIKIKDIRFLSNSRMRNADDVADLMSDIEQHGLLEPIGIRKTDNAIIYGNRRVAACRKLDWDEIDCIFYDDVSDEDLSVLNLIENIKRDNLNSIEVGKTCLRLKENGMLVSEISARLGISRGRVESSISAYKVTAGTPFEKLIGFGTNVKDKKGVKIPESVIWKIQNTIPRAMSGRKLTKTDWNHILSAIESGLINSKNTVVLRNLLSTMEEPDVAKAIELLPFVRIAGFVIAFNDKKLSKALTREKITSPQQFVIQLIRRYDEELLA